MSPVSLPLEYRASDCSAFTELGNIPLWGRPSLLGRALDWSGKQGTILRPSPCHGAALPTELFPVENESKGLERMF
jgi:hypothetical protein